MIPTRGGLATGPSELAGLYVHVPFCARACPYCDFDFEVGRHPDVEGYLAGLEAELRARPEVMSTEFETIYIGGGTPSLLGGPGLGRLFAWLSERIPGIGSARETTVELNPEHVTQALLAALVDNGVDRVSVGTQTLAPAGLSELGRAHDRAASLVAIERAVALGLRVSADLIVGWRGQTPDTLREDVSGLLAAGAEHVSCYALTIEPDTPWQSLIRRGQRVLPDADQQTDLLLLAERWLVDAGLIHYEVSSYARPGARSLHNLKYWTWDDYVGLGPSAASARYDASGVARRTNRRGLAAWRSNPSEPATFEWLEGRTAAAEGLWTGLRALEGLDVDRFLRRFPAASRPWLDERTRRQLERGNVEWDGPDRLRIADGRWVFHDTVALDLLT